MLWLDSVSYSRAADIQTNVNDPHEDQSFILTLDVLKPLSLFTILDRKSVV